MIALTIAFVVCLTALCGGLMWLLHTERTQNRAQVDELTSKIVAKSISEYAQAKQTETHPPVKKEQPKIVKDEVLGSKF